VAQGGFSHHSYHSQQSEHFSQTHEHAFRQEYVEKTKEHSGHTLEGDFERKD